MSSSFARLHSCQVTWPLTLCILFSFKKSMMPEKLMQIASSKIRLMIYFKEANWMPIAVITCLTLALSHYSPTSLNNLELAGKKDGEGMKMNS